MPPLDKKNLDDQSDRYLISRALASEDRAFTVLMRRFKLPLFRFALRHVRDADDAEDVVQEAFIASYRNLKRYNPKYEVSTWLYQITLNKCRDLGRKRKTRSFLQRMTPMLEDKVSKFSSPDNPESQLMEQGNMDDLKQQIITLPQTLREPLILCALEDFSHKQAAKILGISAKAVEMRVYRARKILETFLDPHEHK